MGLLCPHENTLITRINLDTMNPFVRTNHTTHSLLLFSKMVVVLLLIFLPAIAFANPIYQSSSNRYATPSTVGAQSMQYQPASYQMTNTSNYQMSTTYNPAQTVYEPFSDETPSSSGQSRISGRRNTEEEEVIPGTPSDPGNRDPNSPIGEPWVLLVFAAIAAIVIKARGERRKKRLEVKG